MRILSWNVNGIRSVEQKGFLAWLRAESPDILCVQETKARPEQLSPALRAPLDADGAPYYAYWMSAKRAGYAGTALYSKTEPREVRPLGVPEFDDEGRVLEAEFKDWTIISAYFPNSQEGAVRLPYKLAFCAAIFEHCSRLARAGRHFILSGDYNIAHTPIDLARPKANEGNPGYLPEERAWMDAWTGAGFVDTFRRFHPGEGGHYTWWSYRAKSRERNVGWRLDYHCVDPAFFPRVKSSTILGGVPGSDHCPVEIVL